MDVCLPAVHAVGSPSTDAVESWLSRRHVVPWEPDEPEVPVDETAGVSLGEERGRERMGRERVRGRKRKR